MHLIRVLRDHLGLSQAEFGAQVRETSPEIRLHPSYLSTIETGATRCGARVAVAVAKRFPEALAVLEIDVNDLMRGARAHSEPQRVAK